LSAATTTATGLLFSLTPAWRSQRVEINAVLKDTARNASVAGRRWRGSPLVAFQVCLSVLLLIGAGLFIRTLWNLTSVSLGFQPDRVLLFSVDPPRTRYPGERRNMLFQRLHETIATMPGVETASLSGATVLAGGSSQTGVATDLSKPEERRLAWVNEVGFDFFKTMGIPILQGRPLDRRDVVNSQPVAVVSQRFAREFFPDQNPLGKSFRNGNRVLEIVGVSADAKYDRVRSPFPPTFYRSYLQEDPGNLSEMTFEVRIAGSEEAVVRAIREAVASIDRDLPMFDVRTQNEQIAATMSQEQLFVTLTVTFAALAVLLACVGIYGIVACSVARRTNEIGIRIALGADRRRVVVMILREAALVATLGAAAGVAIALASTRYIQSMLFGVEPADPLTMAAAAALMLLVALAAGWVPARRAAHLEPMVALRHE
jgi:predicted permease